MVGNMQHWSERVRALSRNIVSTINGVFSLSFSLSASLTFLPKGLSKGSTILHGVLIPKKIRFGGGKKLVVCFRDFFEKKEKCSESPEMN